MHLKKILIIAGILLWSGVCYAAPTILSATPTTTWAHGNTITIASTGTDFGAHADNGGAEDYLHKLFDFIDTDANSLTETVYGPRQIATDRTGDGHYGQSYNWTSGNSQAYTDIWAESKNTHLMYNADMGLGTGNEEQIIFISAWFMFPSGFVAGIDYEGDGNGEQAKFLMLSPYDNNNKTYWNVRDSNGDAQFLTNTEDGDLAESFMFAAECVEGTWYRFDIYVDVTKGENAKIHEWYLNGKKISRSNEYYNETAAPSGGFESIIYQGYTTEGDVTETWFINADDYYLDYTPARVEICDNAIWDTSTQRHCEIQEVNAWSTSEITITLNEGTLDADDGAQYLYVIDIDNTPSDQDTDAGGSQGFLIEAGGDTTAPVISGGGPTGEQLCESNPETETLVATTDENATCKYGLTDNDYDDMSDTFSTTGTTSHSQSLTNRNCGQSWTYYVDCEDANGNHHDAAANTAVSFSVAAEAGGSETSFSGGANTEFSGGANTTIN